MNFDRRSATLNTEAGLLIDSPELVAQFFTLLEFDRFRSAYRVIRGSDGATQWVESTPEGQIRTHISEPGRTLDRTLWNALLSLFIDEDWL
jgi:putative cardiolipin synthase